VPAGVELALAVEAHMRACPGIAGLDPDSRLSTVGPGQVVRGVRVTAPAGARGTAVTVDLVGLADARLHEAAEAARAAVLDIVTARGLAPGPVEVRLTDVSARPLPPQETETAVPALARAREPEPAAPAPPAPPPPAPPAAPGAGSSAPTLASQTVRIAVAAPDGTEIVLAVTVSVEVERP
jgi:hypothetical protein